MPEQFHFLQPQWFLALIPLVPLLWLVRRPDSGESAWRRVCDPGLLSCLLINPGKGHGVLPLWLLAGGWLVAVIALADPVWEKQLQPVFRSQDARVIVLDLSRSMYTPDLKPSRLARVRYKIEDLLDRSEEGQTGLVAFAGDAFVVAPLTRDADTISSLLAALDPGVMPVQGSRADLGLRKAAELMQQAGIPRGEILLVADGYDGPATLDVAAKLRERGYTVSVLGVGTAEGAPLPNGQGGYLHDDAGNIVMPVLDVAAMGELAGAGGGRYAGLSDNSADLDWLLAGSGPRLDTQTGDAGLETEEWQSRGPWLVLLLLPLAALAFRRGWLLSVLLLVSGIVMTPGPAMASAWDDLWSRRDQQAARALETGDLARAAELAEDPLRRGTAEYRAGNFAQSLESFAGARGADAEYNRGNALARLGRYEDAIAAYDKALAEQPGMADAEHNKDVLEEWLRQQQPQSAQNPSQSQPQEEAGGESSAEDNAQRAGEGTGRDQPASGAESANEAGMQEGESGQDSAAAPDDSARVDPATAAENPGDAPDTDATQAGQQGDEPQTGSEDAAATPARSFAEAVEQQSAPEESSDFGTPATVDAGTDDMPPGDAPGTPPGQVTDSAAAGEATQSLAGASAEPLSTEEQQAAEQWLRRIPDDPGGLLRRKFLYQYRQRAASAGSGSGQAW